MPRRRLRPRELPESTQPGRETSWGWGWGSKPGQMAPVSFCSDSALHLVTGCTQRLEGLTLHPHKQPPSANNWALFEKGPQHLSEPFFFFSFLRGYDPRLTALPWARSALSGPGSAEPRTKACGLRVCAGCGYRGPDPAERAQRPGREVPAAGRRARRRALGTKCSRTPRGGLPNSRRA